MATQIDKKDTLDIADSIATKIVTVLTEDGMPRFVRLREMIQEELDGWISERETEDAEFRAMEHNDEDI